MMQDNRYNLNKCELTPYVAYVLAQYCTPTLMDIKPSSLFNVSKRFAEAEGFFALLARELLQFNCSYVKIYETEKKYLLFIYNREILSATLRLSETYHFLTSYGYMFQDNSDECINQSMDHFKDRYVQYKMHKAEFPHEVGVLLGYPLSDVKAFIENKGENYLISGCWKVYHNVIKAQETFQNYQRAREKALKIVLSGGNISDIMIQNRWR